MVAHLNLAFLCVDHLPDYMCDVNLAFLCVDHYFMRIPLAKIASVSAGPPNVTPVGGQRRNYTATLVAS